MKLKLIIAIVLFAAFGTLAFFGFAAMGYEDSILHNLPVEGGCVSSVAKVLPCSKESAANLFLAFIFSFYALAFFLFIGLAASWLFDNHFFSRSRYRRKQFLQSLSYNKIYLHWLALFENSPSVV